MLKQLAAYLGDDVFLAGVRAHITSNEFGNATFADLVAKWTEAGAVGLDDWAQNWLRTPGVDTISAERTATGITLRRIAPADFPADRPHQLTVGGYDESGRGYVRPGAAGRRRGARSTLDPSVAVVIPDAADDTWAKIRLDADSLAQPRRRCCRRSTTASRGPSILNSIRDATADAELDPRLGFDVLLGRAAARDQRHRRRHDGRLGADAAARHLPALRAVPRSAGRRTGCAAAAPRRPGAACSSRSRVGMCGSTDDAGLLKGWLAGERRAGRSRDGRGPALD